MEVKQCFHKIGTTLLILEGGTQWENRAELYVGLFKEYVCKDMRNEDSPMVLWDYCSESIASITNMTAKNLFKVISNTSHFTTFGEDGYISNICQFRCYGWIYFRKESAAFSFPSHVLRRWLVPAKNKGIEMAQCFLKSNYQIAPLLTMRKISSDEIVRESEFKKHADFAEAIKQRYGDSLYLSPWFKYT